MHGNEDCISTRKPCLVIGGALPPLIVVSSSRAVYRRIPPDRMEGGGAFEAPRSTPQKGLVEAATAGQTSLCYMRVIVVHFVGKQGLVRKK